MTDAAIAGETVPSVELVPLFERALAAIAEGVALKRPATAFRDAIRDRSAEIRRIVPDLRTALLLLAAQTGPRRAALRAIAGVAFARARHTGVERLFSAEAGWRDDRREDIEAFLVYSAAVRGDSDWERRRLLAVGRHPDAALRIAALECRIRVAKLSGIDDAGLRELVTEAMNERGSNIAIKRGAADLIWKLDAPDLIEPLFERFPALRRDVRIEAVAARLMLRGPKRLTAGLDRPRLKALARKVERVETATAAFWAGLADPALSVAVVGNSTCETGLGQGAEIDAHGVVVRFNLAPEDGGFAADYGERCDVKVLNTEHGPVEATATGAPIVALKNQSQLIRQLPELDALADAGRALVFIPATAGMALRRMLFSPPTTGLLFLAQLRAARGTLRGVSLYGFSLVDHLEPGARDHYFSDENTAAQFHDWRAERALLDGWLAEARAAA